MGLYYRVGGRNNRTNALLQASQVQASEPATVFSPHGSLHQVVLSHSTSRPGLLCRLTFALSADHPLFLWKMGVINQTRHPCFLDRLELLNAGFIVVPVSTFSPSMRRAFNINRSSVRLHPERGELAFFSNGWQSWSYTGVYSDKDHYRRTRLGPFRSPTNVNAGTPQPSRAGLFASDMFGVLGDRTHRTGVLAGFLSQKQHFGSLEALTDPIFPAIRMWANGDGARLDPGMQIETDWACLHFLHLDVPDPLGPYLEAVAREHDLPPMDKPIPTGWCSWYQFSSDEYVGSLSAHDVEENLSTLVHLRTQLPLQVVQIDDGFESRVGDWNIFQPDFPHGVAPIAQQIRQAGLVPGLWMAPYIAHPKSRLAADHPEWLLRSKFGRYANAGYLWNTFIFALDLTSPGALEHVCQVVRRAVEGWGYRYLKLDFLYAAALPGKRKDPTRTRAQILRSGLKALRDSAGDEAFLLGCGCPLGPAIGLVDAMRIGADTSRRWNPSFRGTEFLFSSEPNLPAARSASHNALTRAPLHRRWWINDPDCLLLRPSEANKYGSRLTLAEVQTLATIITISGGSLFLSDHLPNLPPERLHIAQALLPLIGKVPHILDWFENPTPQRVQLNLEGPSGRWHLLALFNWDDRPADLSLDLNNFYLDFQGEFSFHSFWDDHFIYLHHNPSSPGSATLANIPAHGVALLAARPIKTFQPVYLGSTLHISQGMEVVAWGWKGQAGPLRQGELALELERPGFARGQIYLYLPFPPQRATLNQQPVTWRHVTGNSYSFTVNFDKTAQIIINL